MSYVIDLVHYMHTSEIRLVEPCQPGTHTPMHVVVHQVDDGFIAYCNACRVATKIKDQDDYDLFVEGKLNYLECPRPFHEVENVDEDRKFCKSCEVVVELVSHPSFSGTRWYG